MGLYSGKDALKKIYWGFDMARAVCLGDTQIFENEDVLHTKYWYVDLSSEGGHMSSHVSAGYVDCSRYTDIRMVWEISCSDVTDTSLNGYCELNGIRSEDFYLYRDTQKVTVEISTKLSDLDSVGNTDTEKLISPYVILSKDKTRSVTIRQTLYASYKVPTANQ